MKGRCRNKEDELSVLIRNQKEIDFIKEIGITKASYFAILYNNRQLTDIEQFCCEEKNPVPLGIDTTFNLTDLWLTDTSYRNLRIVKVRDAKHPVFLGPCMLHFTKDASTFSRFFLGLNAGNPGLRELKAVGVDMEAAIFDGFEANVPGIKRLVCVRHIKARDEVKANKLLEKTGKSASVKAKCKIDVINDIYGERNGSCFEYGLAESHDENDFNAKLNELKEKWNKLIPGFFDWFVLKRQKMFISSVIDSARKDLNVEGLYYQNDVESLHSVEKCIQEYTKEDVITVIQNLSKLCDRQDVEEIRALYGSGSYVLTQQYSKFKVDTKIWHGWSEKKRKDHVKAFRSYRPTLTDQFTKPKSAGKKPSQKRQKKNPAPDVVEDRHRSAEPVSQSIRFQDPTYVYYFLLSNNLKR